MADDLERVLRGLEAAREFARTYRFEMTDDYRALIARVEAMPRNQPGADRSGRWVGSLADLKAVRALVTPAPCKRPAPAARASVVSQCYQRINASRSPGG